MPTDKKCYAVKHKDGEVRAASRSGGIFTALSDLILEENGVVYGCVLSEDFTIAEHIRATTKEERNRMRGSKYIPSDVHDCYKKCGEDLSNGKSVLFSGTPCQIEALNCYLEVKKIDTSKLLRLDVLCHTVASPLLWNLFLKWRADGKHIDSADFRDKGRFGWAHHEETVVVDGKAYSSRIFASLFGKNLASPACCSDCRFKSTERPSDITLGDYWSIDNLDRSFNDNMGVSLVLVSTEKGAEYFEKCRDSIEVKQFDLFDSMQPAFEKSVRIPDNQNEFFSDLSDGSFDEIIKKYINTREKLYIRIGRFFKKLLKR